jgi:hypothetical protein
MCCHVPPFLRNFANTHIASQSPSAALRLHEYLHEISNLTAIVPAFVSRSVSGVVGSALTTTPCGPARVGVAVGVVVGVIVGVVEGVEVGVTVGVSVGVLVGVLVGVNVGVLVGVSVGVLVGVSVGVFVGVLVGV